MPLNVSAVLIAPKGLKCDNMDFSYRDDNDVDEEDLSAPGPTFRHETVMKLGDI